MDQEERSRVRIVISAQRYKAKATYHGRILVDMGGHEIQRYNGPVILQGERLTRTAIAGWLCGSQL
jgi:hypothetical protein